MATAVPTWRSAERSASTRRRPRCTRKLTHRILGNGSRECWNRAVGSERSRRHLSFEMAESPSDGEVVVLPRRAGQQPRRGTDGTERRVDILDGVGEELDHLEQEERRRLRTKEVSDWIGTEQVGTRHTELEMRVNSVACAIRSAP
jgi:hypothetical protein